ncbi:MULTISPECIES: glycine cleavage system protein GcvH [unclassified Lentimonas]|uniref:glycine cleavage system protein GcvH n=1 Tax=unclassified Lentimonas TaxID=2630993 RepID=UPI001329CAF4|nr:MULTISPECIES: glycine cleavage system protein GcvH [unclassified Lentimonas]CAA6678767.1 Glycine cleavage system H protein [Lentimonas sp. CC4]CAA6683753.1 Glycine cleavage system H protein [Lentimonas sp. CC6]CAA6690164.1 Glycine cleavage system H protein [Lentimonas sp. CC10]CAA6696003.1 Glycine cleavage system H protein [Lentimonas sp. CC19]CAA7070212.1 Glycine cleavage system H protein [Lentimonas sp. CC11]
MSELPADLLYTKDHEWVKMNNDGTATVGITDYAQESLGDITFVEFPEVGATLEVGDTFGVVESVKAASDLYMPLSGEVIEINEAVDDAPELVNQEAFNQGWLLKIRLSDASQVADLMTPEAYSELI